MIRNPPELKSGSGDPLLHTAGDFLLYLEKSKIICYNINNVHH